MIYSKKIIRETEKTLALLTEEKQMHPNEGILDPLLTRYREALEAAMCHDPSAFLHLRGGCKAYIDATYQYDSPLADQLYRMENMCEKFENRAFYGTGVHITVKTGLRKKRCFRNE